jgi:alkylation response protein AidB-like acyl-CoA dehydrogenase
VDLELTGEQTALRDAVARFLADRAPITPYVREQLASERGTTDAVWDGLTALGVTGLLVSGGDMTTVGVVLEQLGRAVHPGPFLSSAVAATRAMLRLAPEAERDLIARLANGTTIGTVAILEPGLAHGWEGARCAVERSARLTGEKRPVLDAMAADVFLVLAGDLGLYAVDRHAPGVEVEPLVSIDGTRKMGVLRLRDAPAHLVGRGGHAAIEPVIDDVLVALASDALGAADRALELAVEYAKVREQFGKPIGSFQAVQHLCVGMLEAVELTRGAVLFAQWAADHAPADDYHRAAVMAKAHGGALVGVAESAIQVFGGIGYTWEHDVHLFYKRLLSFDAYLGSSTAHLRALGAAHIADALA